MKLESYAKSLLLLMLVATVAQAQNQRDIAVRKDKQDLSNDASWIYDDLDAAFEEAATTKRPLMIVFR